MSFIRAALFVSIACNVQTFNFGNLIETLSKGTIFHYPSVAKFSKNVCILGSIDLKDFGLKKYELSPTVNEICYILSGSKGAVINGTLLRICFYVFLLF